MKDIITNKIEVDNCSGMCVFLYCSKKQTNYFEHVINNYKVLVGVCEKHAEILENSNFIKCNDPPVIECEEREDITKGLKFYCEYCAEEHLHGIGDGHRLSHCKQNSPYSETGYILKLKQ